MKFGFIFLFHVKGCLDVLNQLIRRAYRLPYDQTYKNGEEALIRNLDNKTAVQKIFKQRGIT
jgi:hypothetical protein